MSFLPPLLLHYFVTYRCNCRCRFCDIWQIPAPQKFHANVEDVFRNLYDARRLGVRFVDFTGGEPLLHDDLPDMLKYAKKLGYQTTVTTNCLRYVKESGRLRGWVDFLHFSLDALDARQHDALRGRSVFDQVMHSLDVARDLGESPDLLFTVSSENINQIVPLADFALALGLMLVVNPVFSYAAVPHLDVELLKKLEDYAARPFVYVNTAFHRLRRLGGNQRRAPRCRVVDSAIVMSPDNKVILPCFHFQQQALEIGGELQENFQMQQSVLASRSLNFSRACNQIRGFAKNALTQRAYSKSFNKLRQIRHSSSWRFYQKNQGRFDFCQGCTLNCYFDPSFLYYVDAYFWSSLLAKSRYWWDKNIRRNLEQKKLDHRPAKEIAAEIMENYDLT